MAAHSNILAWRIPWTEEPGGLQSMGSQKVGHNCVSDQTHTFSWKKKREDGGWGGQRTVLESLRLSLPQTSD